MKVTAKFFSVYREIAGTDRLTLDLSEDATVEEAIRLLHKRLKGPVVEMDQTVFMVNQNRATPETRLKEGDEILLLYLLGGG
jgi:molybdopterin converting factor small subunit